MVVAVALLTLIPITVGVVEFELGAKTREIRLLNIWNVPDVDEVKEIPETTAAPVPLVEIS